MASSTSAPANNGKDHEDPLPLTVDGKPVILSFNSTEFLVRSVGEGAEKANSKCLRLHTALQHVLFAEVDPSGEVQVSTLALKKKLHVLVKIRGRPSAEDKERAKEWVAQLMHAAGCRNPGRRLKVIVNPFGGKGLGRSIFEKGALPVLEAAKCSLDVSLTTHKGHGEELARELDIEAFDAIVVVSGDGVVHEVFNGLASRPDAKKAFQLPVAHIPAGSGNAISVSILGRKDCVDVSKAALNVIKGSPMKLDLASVTQGDERRISFISQAIGLMADLDLGTESLRWMGEKRFLLGFLKGVAYPKACPIKVWLKVVENDKQKMVETYQSDLNPPEDPSEGLDGGHELPPLRFRDADNEGWYQFPEPLLYLYGGMVPFVSRDLMQFPMAHPSDGCLDVVIQSMTDKPRSELLKGLEGSHNGQQFWLPTQHYFKVHAYRVIPLAQKGHLSIDGEAWPYQPFQVEVHPRLATTLSMHGRFAAQFSCD